MATGEAIINRRGCDFFSLLLLGAGFIVSGMTFIAAGYVPNSDRTATDGWTMFVTGWVLFSVGVLVTAVGAGVYFYPRINRFFSRNSSSVTLSSAGEYAALARIEDPDDEVRTNLPEEGQPPTRPTSPQDDDRDQELRV